VAQLRALAGPDGLQTERVRQAAAAMGVSERTLWRWLRTDPMPEPAPRGYRLSAEDLDEYMARRGNAAAVWRARYGRGAGPSKRTLQRAFERELRPGDRAAVVSGAEGRRRHEVYLRWEAARRNDIWEADHKELEVLVLAPRAQRPQKPWATLFLDAYSRLIMGWAISLRPSAATVLAALGKAIRLDPERGPFGGVPSVLRWDNGLEFAADALASAAGVLGAAIVPTAAYSPHQKGKLERTNRTLTQELLSGLPFYTHGPRAIDGRLYGPDAPPMALARFVEEFDRWVRDYNTKRPHAGLGGLTPLQRWCADATPLRQVADADLRWLLLADVRRIIHKDGIHFNGLVFVAPELNGRVGQEVEVRYTPHDDRQIEVFRDGRWLATARPQNALSAEERDRVLEQRRADAAEQARRQRRASRQARVRLAAMTEPGVPEVSTVIGREQGRLESAHADDLALRRQARLWLLGLPEPPAPGDPGEQP
jgi:putative transposase